MIKNKINISPRFPFYPLIAISLCAAFQFYKYVLQVYPSIITDQLMNEFDLTGSELGNLAATFYYTFVITQLFVGMLLDKFSVRWISSIAILCCTLGVLFFSLSHHALTAGLCRALIGVGVAFSTVTYMKLAAVLFSKKHYAFISGLLATATMAGAVFGQIPLSSFIRAFGWRHSLLLVALLGFFLTILFFAVIRDGQIYNTDTKSSISFNDILRVIGSKRNWLLTFYGGLAFSPLSVFGGLWGNPFLQQAYHLSKIQAASMISLIFIGLGVGSPLIGLISERISNKLQVMYYFTLIALISLSIVLYFHSMPVWVLAILLFTFGFSLGAYLLAFAVGKDINNIHLTATVVAMINAGDALLTGITEPAIGKLLDLSWDGTIVSGIHFFKLHNYQIALTTLPIYLVMAVLIIFFMKSETTSRHESI